MKAIDAMNAKRKTVRERIERLEEAISKGREYLTSGAHADWHKFRPMFVTKERDGEELPPHPDWVRNVFLRRRESELRRAEKLLERLTQG